MARGRRTGSAPRTARGSSQGHPNNPAPSGFAAPERLGDRLKSGDTSRRLPDATPRGSVFVIFTFVVAAAEVAVGLGIVLAAYRNHPTVEVDEIHELKG